MQAFLNLQEIVRTRQAEVQSWLQEQINKTPALLHASVDTRSSGFKVAHVDTNLFPAGFNNLTPSGVQRAIEGFSHYLKNHFPNVRKVLLIPESFTRNVNYLHNVMVLQKIITAAGMQVQVAFLPGTELNSEVNFLVHQPMQRLGNKIVTELGWQPDLIILNNDLTSGVPEILHNISQPIIPDVKYGWYQRKKSANLEAYATFANLIAEKFSFDSWLINTYWHKCGLIDFRQKTGLECVANAVEKVLHKTRQKYKEHNITDVQPHAFIKAENGTHGVGIMVVHSAEEVMQINKKQRHSMNTLKSGVHNTEVVVQEGVPTALSSNGKVHENVFYLVSGKPVGVIKRLNSEKGKFDNLNSRGMELLGTDDLNFDLEYIIASLASLAASREF